MEQRVPEKEVQNPSTHKLLSKTTSYNQFETPTFTFFLRNEEANAKKDAEVFTEIENVFFDDMLIKVKASVDETRYYIEVKDGQIVKELLVGTKVSEVDDTVRDFVN